MPRTRADWSRATFLHSRLLDRSTVGRSWRLAQGRSQSGRDAGGSEDLESVLRGGGQHCVHRGRLDGCWRKGERFCRLRERAQEVLEPGGLDHKEEARFFGAHGEGVWNIAGAIDE